MPSSVVQKALLAICALMGVLWTTAAAAAGIYSQVVVTFPEQREVVQAYHQAEHALVLTFKKTAPNELGAFDQYDERLIKRILMKDLGPEGTEVKLILRGRDVRALVSQFTEPFRVTVDLFDANYSEERDPTTGLPLVGGAGTSESSTQAPDAVPGRSTSRNGETLKTVEPVNSDDTEAAAAPSTPSASGKRQLLIPAPELFSAPAEFTAAMREASDGNGKSWKNFPPYMYHLQLGPYEAGLGLDRQGAHPVKALTPAEAMAEYASKLFSFGHEGKALLAYQQVLRKDPGVFDRNALHLWKFAESHIGQGNLTLAEGYDQALIEKHPESPLANFARLRLLDLEALKLLNTGKRAQWPSLLPKLEAVKVRHAGELAALVALRQAWWSTANASQDPQSLPKLSGNLHQTLSDAYPLVESSTTGFLTASLLLKDLLNTDAPWQRPTGQFAEAYFKRFTGAGAEPYRTQLAEALDAKVNQNLVDKVASGKLVEASFDYEALPAENRKVDSHAKTAWALAEAYRKLAQTAKAAPLYRAAAKGAEGGPDRFKALFWESVTAGDLSQTERQAGHEDKANQLAKQSRDADHQAWATWKELKDSERDQVAVAYKDAFERTVSAKTRLTTGPQIVLANWTKALATKVTATSAQAGADTSDFSRNFSPSGGAVLLLTDLGKRFGELGMTAERRQAIGLLKNMKPADFEGDAAAKAAWTHELVGLAEDYRKASEYLEAGRLMALVGDGSSNWEGRAETLYKGGLLLYRAGRRAEAVDSLKKASEDGNNMFYANLAKERLSQLQ